MSSASLLPPIDSLRSLEKEEQIRALDLLFEPSPELHVLILPLIQERSFTSYRDLVDECGGRITTLAQDSGQEAKNKLHGILGSHPRLGAPKVASAQSAAEQARLNHGEVGPGLAALNAEYEARYPGLRYVVFVNGRGRPEIMEDIRRRIARGDMALEEKAAIEAMCAIAHDRASKCQAASV